MPRTPEKRKAVRILFKATPCLNLSTNPSMFKTRSAQNKRAKKRVKTSVKSLAKRQREYMDTRIKIFYASSYVSRPLPHRRYATKNGPAFAMLITKRAAYKLFCIKFPHARVGYTKFCSLKPRNVRRLGTVDVETCLCLCCQNLRYKIDVLNRHLDPRDVLPAEGKILDIILCPRNGKWHNINCVRGKCNKCQKFIAPIKAKCAHLMTLKVRWAHWERGPTERGIKLDVHAKSGSISDLLLEKETDLAQPVRGTSFPEHLFTAYWQQSQYKYLLNTLMPGEVLMVEDFAENRKAAYSAEVKSAYFSKSQITLHPIVCYYKDEGYQLVRHSLMYVSDDTLHDHHLVNKFTRHALEFLKTETVIQSAFIYSDGCASQYKGKGTFADLSLMAGLRVHRVFYGSDHGKGEADGETGILSQAMSRYVQGGNDITSAKGLFNWASETLTQGQGTRRRTFFLISAKDVARNRSESDILTIPGTRKMHQVERVNDYIIQSRCLACFCCACRSGRTSLCINKDVVGDFITHKLKQRDSGLDEAFIEDPEAEGSEKQPEEADAQVVNSDKRQIAVGAYVKWTYTVGKKTLAYYALVLTAEDNQLLLSCLRPRPAGSSQSGEVWVFPEAPDLNDVVVGVDNIMLVDDPEIDLDKKLYIFK